MSLFVCVISPAAECLCEASAHSVLSLSHNMENQVLVSVSCLSFMGSVVEMANDQTVETHGVLRLQAYSSL